MLTNPSLSWQKLQDVYYCLRPCYESLNWSIDNLYSNYKVKISKDTTVIALASKFVPHPNLIEVYSLSGTKLWSMIYNSSPSDHIVDFAFRNEDLCVVLNNQKFRYYRDFKGTFNEYNYTQDLINLTQLQETGIGAYDDPNSNRITNLENNQTEEVYLVQLCEVYDKFLVLKLKNSYIITDLDTFKNYKISFTNLQPSKFHCSSFLSFEDNILTILSSYDTSIISIKVDFSIETYEITDHELTDGPFTQINSSPNHSLIALFNDDVSKVFVINSSFDQVLLEYDSSNDSSSPYQVEWCGNDAIVLSLRDEVKLVGPGQRCISFFYDIIDEEDFDLEMISKDNNDLSFTIPIIKTECDGLKIITSGKIEFLSRVLDPMVNLYQIGSSHPCSILLDCVDKLAQQSSKSDTNISLLKSDDSLLPAMNECLKAALEEFSSPWQKKILKAVSFGKIFYDDYFNAEEYLEVLNTIKILNQIRASEIGLFFTNSQLLNIGWDAVIRMLLRREQHYLCLKIIDMLSLTNSRHLVYIDWCCSKIRKELNMSDIELFKIITTKLFDAAPDSNNKIYMTIEDISNTAFEEGRIDLCKLLINAEPLISKRITQFIKFEEPELALVKSFQSGDFDLCRLMLLYLQGEYSDFQFFQVLNQNEKNGIIADTSLKAINDPKILKTIQNENVFLTGDLVGNFWVNSIGKNSPKILENYLKHEDRKAESSVLKFKEFIKKQNFEVPDGDETSLGEEFYLAYKARLNKLTGRSSKKSSTKLYQLELDLLELKKKLTETYHKSFYSEKTIIDILTKLINMNQLKQAGKVVKDFKVSQQKFWHLVLQTYAQAGEFTKLYKFVVDKSSSTSNLKSPIGFSSFVKTAMFYNAPQDQISIYIQNSQDLTYAERVNLYLTNEDYGLAVDESFKNKDVDLLREINSKAVALGYTDISQTIQSNLTKLGYST